MKISLNKANKESLKTIDAIALNLFVKKGGKPLDTESFGQLDKPIQDALREFVNQGKYKAGDTKILFLPNKNIILNFTDRDSWNMRSLRIAIRKITQFVKQNRFRSMGMFFSDFLVKEVREKEIARNLSENILMAHFDFSEIYKEKPLEGWNEIKEVKIFGSSKALEEGIKEGLIIGEEVNGARLLSNSPAGDMTPEDLAKSAVKEGRKAGFSVKVFDEKKMKTLGMGGILGVGKGSEAKPRFIIMEYRGGKKTDKPLVLVGKGVTFDTGGINLKSTDGLSEMHMDMSGGASVIHALSAISRLKLKINVTGLVPAAENMASGSSYRPGDILKTYSGKTIEIANTDAEGRVILADALGYAKTLNPSLIVDFATLTGAALIALGQRASAIFSKDDNLIETLREVGEKSGDYVWPLPMWDEYEGDVKGIFGDVSNIGKSGRYGGAISGAMFLWQFAKPNLWAHVDIAPTMTSIDGQFLSKGAAGPGVRLMVELAKSWK